jgi:hypothetical protein
MPGNDIEFRIKAKDEASASLQQVARNLDGLRKTQENFQSSMKAVGASFAGVGAITGGLGILQGLVHAARGDSEKMLDAFERLPFGVGAAVRNARDLYDLVSGTADHAKRLAEATERTAHMTEAMARAHKLMADATNENSEFTRKQRSSGASLGLTGGLKSLVDNTDNTDDLLRDVRVRGEAQKAAIAANAEAALKALKPPDLPARQKQMELQEFEDRQEAMRVYQTRVQELTESVARDQRGIDQQMAEQNEVIMRNHQLKLTEILKEGQEEREKAAKEHAAMLRRGHDAGTGGSDQHGPPIDIMKQNDELREDALRKQTRDRNSMAERVMDLIQESREVRLPEAIEGGRNFQGLAMMHQSSSDRLAPDIKSLVRITSEQKQSTDNLLTRILRALETPINVELRSTNLWP